MSSHNCRERFQLAEASGRTLRVFGLVDDGNVRPLDKLIAFSAENSSLRVALHATDEAVRSKRRVIGEFAERVERPRFLLKERPVV